MTDMTARIAAVKARLRIDAAIEGHVKLSGRSGHGQRRGKCPFHGGQSDSFVVRTEFGRAKCYGCQWSGDAIEFVRDFHGLGFLDALADCERMAGILEGEALSRAAAPVQRERNLASARKRGRELVEPVAMGRWIWDAAARDDDAVRRYLIGRGIPADVLTTARLSPFRFLAECPCVRWDAGGDPRGVIHAPAVIAIVRDPAEAWAPVGVHVTYLDPAGTGTMVRRKPWARPGAEDAMLPKRRMLGPVGRGCVVLGHYRAEAALFVGEGNETVLSGMGLIARQPAAEGGAGTNAACGVMPPGGGSVPDDWVGIATLSLDNLQGQPLLRRSREFARIWPLHAIVPDPERPALTIPGHRGSVTGLIDSDMAPLRGMIDRQAGGFTGEAVIERKRGPVVRRAISGADRARICAELFVKSWRDAGAHPVTAVRAPIGMDFNDAARVGAKEAA